MGRYEAFRKRTPKVTGGLVRMRQEVFRDGAIPAKYKILAALVSAVVIRCEPCLRGYVKMAVDAGVSDDELLECLNVAIVESGCPGEQWAMKAYDTLLELRAGGRIEEEICCR